MCRIVGWWTGKWQRTPPTHKRPYGRIYFKACCGAKLQNKLCLMLSSRLFFLFSMSVVRNCLYFNFVCSPNTGTSPEVEISLNVDATIFKRLKFISVYRQLERVEGERYGFQIQHGCGWGRLIACRKTCLVVRLQRMQWGSFSFECFSSSRNMETSRAT